MWSRTACVATFVIALAPQDAGAELCRKRKTGALLVRPACPRGTVALGPAEIEALGLKGEPGDKGERGDKGASSSGDVIATRADLTPLPAEGADFVTKQNAPRLASLDLEPGAYLVAAKVQLYNATATGAFFRCILYGGEPLLDRSSAYLRPGDTTTLPLLGVLTAEAGVTLELRCGHDGPVSPGASLVPFADAIVLQAVTAPSASSGVR